MLLWYFHILFLPHDAINFVKCPSPFSHKTLPQHDSATAVLHTWASVLRLPTFPIFPVNVTMILKARCLAFVSELKTKMCSSQNTKLISFLSGMNLTMFIPVYNHLNRWMWCLQASLKCTQAITRVVEGNDSLPDMLFDFIWVWQELLVNAFTLKEVF